MAEDFRNDDSADFQLSALKSSLEAECAREEENALYTSTSFFIWLRWLKTLRAILWVGGAGGSVTAASHILRGDPTFRITIAALALTGVLLPAIGRALHLDAIIHDYVIAAARFKNLQGEFRRAAQVWSHKPLPEFEEEARRLFKAMNEARKPSLTPPSPCFWLARRKIRKGHYRYDADELSSSRGRC
jgi:hypothetical protein